uniref:Extended-spectrum beta-lactamase n=1 Tax=Escherichia coli TaxID=562 RepID=A0A6C7HJH6_ECOLX|nr:extended-spectrum beta-lactamase [Escherichia coli]
MDRLPSELLQLRNLSFESKNPLSIRLRKSTSMGRCHWRSRPRYSTATWRSLLHVGGPAVTAFARQLGDTFRLDRTEPTYTAIPGDPRTTSPREMAQTLRNLTLGALGDSQRAQLAWKGNTTGAASIQVGLPASWVVGEKPGGGGVWFPAACRF